MSTSSNLYKNSLKIELFLLEVFSKSPSLHSSPHTLSFLKLFGIINKRVFFSSGEDEMRNSLIMVNRIKEVNKHWLKGYNELNNTLNLKTAELYMPILHSRPSKSYKTKNKGTFCRGDSLCFTNS